MSKETDIVYMVSEDLVKGWIFSSIMKKYNIDSQEDAEILIDNKQLRTRVITDKGINYVTLVSKDTKMIAQQPESYFLIPINKNDIWKSESKDQLTESNTQLTNKKSKQTEWVQKKSETKSLKQKKSQIQSNNVIDSPTE